MKHPSPDDVIRLYAQAKSLRSPYENDWRMAAAYCLPAQYASWQTDGPATRSTAAARRVQFDSTGTRAVPKYAAILERLATPIGQKWHTLRPSDAALRKHRRVRVYFEEVSDLLFKYRYNPRARFRTTTSEVYASLGVYGTGPMFMGLSTPTPLHKQIGFKYISCALRDLFILVDDELNVVMVFRRFWLNGRQFKTKFPKDPAPPTLARQADNPVSSETTFCEFIHYVYVRGEDEYDPGAMDASRHPVAGYYVSVPDKQLVGDPHGYRSMPYKTPRTSTMAGDPYGFSPAVQVLSSLGGASTTKKIYLKQGNLAIAPVLLAHDDGVLGGEMDMRPSAINYGGVNKQGQKLVVPLGTGDFRVAETLLEDDRADIKDSFFVSLFQMLEETPQMTATEVVERVAQKSALLSPTMGMLQSEMLGPGIEREIEMLAELGKLPDMPPELVEAAGEYDVVYTSPMAKGIYAEETSGFMRTLEMSMNIASATGDPSVLDFYDFDTAIPEIADNLAVPARWLADAASVKARREQRAEQAEQQMLVENAPGLAGAAKAVTDMGRSNGR